MSEAALPPVSDSDPFGAPNSSQVSGRAAYFPAVVAAAAYLIFWQAAPRIHTDSVGAVLISTVLSLALVVWFPAEFARAVRSPKTLAISAIVAAVAVLPMRFTLLGQHPPAPWSLIERFPGAADLLLIWFAATLGALLSRIVRSVNLIPPVAAVLALVDLWTVLLGGPVQQVLHSASPVARAVTRAMTVRLPGPTALTAGATPIHFVGFADFLFIAFFIAAICRFTDSNSTFRQTVWVLILVLCGYMVLVFFTERHLPALVPMAVVMIGLHWRRFHYERSEIFALIYASIFIALIAAGFWYYGRARDTGSLEKQPPNPASLLLPETMRWANSSIALGSTHHV